MKDRTYPQDDSQAVGQTAASGLFSWDLQTNGIRWSTSMFNLLEIEPGLIEPTLPLFLSLIHFEDRLTRSQVYALPRDGSTFVKLCRMTLPDGQTKVFTTHYGLVLEAGVPIKVAGVCIEADERPIELSRPLR